MIHFTQSVGVAPGTSTVQYNPGGELSCGACHPVAGLSNCPPDYFTPSGGGGPLPEAVPAPGITHTTMNPYANEAALSSNLRGISTQRWDLFILALGLGFAGVLGYSLLKK